ncbi:MAG: 3-oxoacyl-[acyl-carrier-protein] synthase III C-terminal domain-containing protein, partial [Planctomycetaceae bacterium]
LLNGCLLLANMIELGQVSAGVIVGTEIGRGLVEGTIETLLADDSLTRQTIKPAFASLTIGSGSAAIVLCDRRLSRTGHRLLGGSVRSDTAAYQLCAGGIAVEDHGDDRPRMTTDSEALLHAGVELAAATWEQTRNVLGWDNDSVDKSFTHQVGRAHRNLLYERLGIDPGKDFATIEFLGNTGATALPIAAALGAEQGHLEAGDKVAWLGIGSGLSSVMLGIEW